MIQLPVPITLNDQPAKLIVITKVISDNGNKQIAKAAKDFSYTLSGSNKPPSTTFKGASGKGTTITLNPGTTSVNMKGLLASSSSIDFPPNQSYKVTMNNCKNVNLKGGQTATCTITLNDQPAKLIVITKVINDNLGKKIAKQFSYKLIKGFLPFSSPYYSVPPSTVFNGVSGKGTTITVNPGIVSVKMVGESSLVKGTIPNKNRDQSYPFSMNKCTNVNLKGGQTTTCTITLNDNAVKPIVKLYHQGIGKGSICVLSDKENLGCKNVDLKEMRNPHTWNLTAFKETEYGKAFQVCLEISSKEKCVTHKRDRSSYSIVAPKIAPMKECTPNVTVKNHNYMQACATVHPDGKVDSIIKTWNRAHFQGFTGSYQLQFFGPDGNEIAKCCYHAYGVTALYLNKIKGLAGEENPSAKRIDPQTDNVGKEVVDATHSLKITLKYDPKPRYDEFKKEAKEVVGKFKFPAFIWSQKIPFVIPIGGVPIKGSLDVIVDTSKKLLKQHQILWDLHCQKTSKIH